MSETDDTDDLLLIPPDFFVIDSEFEEQYSSTPYYKVVDTLITQVNNLETRINSIELSSENSISSVTAERSNCRQVRNFKYMTEPRRSISSDDVHRAGKEGFESTQSTPQKPRSIFKLNSLPATPNVKRYNPRRTRNVDHPCKIKPADFERKDNVNNIKYEGENNNLQKTKIFNDIEEFITNVNTLKKISASRNLEREMTSHINNEQKVPGLKNYDVDSILNEMENQLEMQLLARGEHINNKPITNGPIVKEKMWQCGDYKSSVPDLGFGMRDMMGKSNSSKESSSVSLVNKHSATSYHDQMPSTTDASFNSEYMSDDSSNASSHSQPTVFQNLKASNYEQISNRSNVKPIYESNCGNKKKTLHRRDVPPEGNTKYNYSMQMGAGTKLLSLKELWEQNDSHKNLQLMYIQKLEEEKIKRQHCEQLIQELQVKVLELQEKLAVAIEVDKSKDSAILKFHDAWEKVAIRLKGLSKEKSVLEEDIREFQAKSAIDLAEAAKKVAFYESESSKALNLAHANQEKALTFEQQNQELTKQIENLKKELSDSIKKYDEEKIKSKHLSNLVTEKEGELNKTKECLDNARKEISHSKKAIDICQAEFISMKAQYTHMELQINNDMDRIRELEAFNKKLLLDVETYKRNEKDLRDEVQKTREQNENNKIELRNFYQDQVELVVRDKLKEFQLQLDQAESSLQEELKKRELNIIKSAAMHIQQITDKHQLEIQLLEEKHKEEVRLFNIQLSQTQRHTAELQEKFKQQREYKANITEQLQKVMEAQWHEAIRILNSGRSPGLPQDTNNTLDQLNSLKSKSYNNVEELLNITEKDVDSRKPTNKNHSDMVFDTTYSSAADEEDRRVGDNYMETPITSKQVRSRQQIENDLQRFINLLMNKSKTADKHQEMSTTKPQENSIYDGSHNWQIPDESRPSRSSIKDKKLNKPPWK